MYSFGICCMEICPTSRFGRRRKKQGPTKILTASGLNAHHMTYIQRTDSTASLSLPLALILSLFLTLSVVSFSPSLSLALSLSRSSHTHVSPLYLSHTDPYYILFLSFTLCHTHTHTQLAMRIIQHTTDRPSTHRAAGKSDPILLYYFVLYKRVQMSMH